MGKVVYFNSVSLDGYAAGPNDSPENGLGDGGEALFDWYFSGDVEVQLPGSPLLKMTPESAAVFKEGAENLGAMICGRKMFDIAGAWGGNPPGSPCFVVTHNVPQEWAGPDSKFIFVTDGVESAIAQAKQTAGDKDVSVASASIARQCLQLGLLDEIHLAVVPLLLGAGARWFDDIGGPIPLKIIRVVPAQGVTHLAYRVVK